MVPGTAHRIVDHESLDQWPVIMRAMRAHGEHLVAAPHEEDFLLAHMADELAAIRGGSESQPLRQIGSGRLVLLLGHSASDCRRCNLKTTPPGTVFQPHPSIEDVAAVRSAFEI